MAIRVCVAAALRLFMGLFFCTFARFPALFQSQFVLLSIFLIIHGDLTCFQKAHGQAADHKGGNGEPPAAVSRVPPLPHVRILANFIRLLLLASYCVDATERRASAAPKAAEIHKTRNPRPFTGFFFGLYMHPNRPLDPKIVFNQHPKPPNGITNAFRFSAHSHSWVVNFLILFH